jgi:hypothetical protein
MNYVILKNAATRLTLTAFITLLGACATAPSPQAENTLLSAGFKAKVASTTRQRQELRILPEGTVSAVTRKGKTYYVYPDASQDKLYVGNKTQYQTYKQLITPPRDSSGPLLSEWITPSATIPVETIYDWPPFDEL